MTDEDRRDVVAMSFRRCHIDADMLFRILSFCDIILIFLYTLEFPLCKSQNT